MYVTISDFIKEWDKEAILTQKVLDGLTDDSLKHRLSGRSYPGKDCVASHNKYSRLSSSFRV